MFREVKVCFLGDTAVGKTCIVTHYVHETFQNMEPTVGAAFQSKLAEINGNSFRFQIWDTAGQEKYRAMAPLYYRGAAAAVLVYDITRPETFECVTYWVDELRKYSETGLVIVLVGNKVDQDALREIPAQNGEALAKNIKAHFLETSARNGQNIHMIFETIAGHLPNIPKPPAGRYRLEEKQKKNNCC